MQKLIHKLKLDIHVHTWNCVYSTTSYIRTTKEGESHTHDTDRDIQCMCTGQVYHNFTMFYDIASTTGTYIVNKTMLYTYCIHVQSLTSNKKLTTASKSTTSPNCTRLSMFSLMVPGSYRAVIKNNRTTIMYMQHTSSRRQE